MKQGSRGQRGEILSRRFFMASPAVVGSAMLVGGQEAAQASDLGPQHHADGISYNPVVTPNGTSLPVRIVDDTKVFHLTAEPVSHDFAPGMRGECWGYNGRTPGPTMEVVEGDFVRIYVTNRWRRRSEPALHTSWGDLPVRIQIHPSWNVHVPSACRRNDSNGHGADGHDRGS